jgi:signal transduction histidine kinase/CheY-like chemotaxis protein
MFGWVGRLTDAWTPRVDDLEERTRFRFAVQAWLIAWPIAVIWVLVAAAQGMWLTAALNALMVVVGPPVLWGVYRTKKLTPWFHITLGCALMLYGPGMLAQTPYDETGLFFSVIIPLVAGFMFGGRSALKWTLATSVVAITCLLLAFNGYTFPVADPTPLLTKSLNIVSALAMTALFASAFHAVRRDALERAQAASHAKSLFLASISHEIRTPMNGVLGMTEVMLHEATDPVAREQLEVIKRSGQLLVSLINDLLDVTKLEAQRLTLDESAFALATLLTDLERLYAPLAREKNLALAVRLEPGVPAVLRGDAMRLRQVLFNLVSNGIKFTEKGSVTLTVARGGEASLSFAVDDTGPGIAPAVQQRLFNLFEQGDASTTRRFGGSGLGLALARQLVTLMGGQLTLTSELGHGSRFAFTVRLPEGTLPEPVESAAPVVATTPPRVLVVDDNPINLRVATSLVRKAGYEVDSVTNGGHAVNAASAVEYHAVLMDCHMPEMDGFEATRRIRALPPPFCAVRVIALTASISEEDLQACRHSGMNEVLAKPVSLDALKVALASA